MTQNYENMFIEVIVGNKYFYHGKLIENNDKEIIIDDIKNGKLIISKNNDYIIRPMSNIQKLRLLNKLKIEETESTIGKQLLAEIKNLDRKITEWQEKNREKLNNLFGVR